MRDIFTQKLRSRFPWIKQWHHGDKIEIEPYFAGGDGWYPIWYNMLKEIEAVYASQDRTPDLLMLQSKEKYGGLRFYYGTATDAPDEVIHIVGKYGSISEETCDVCGQPSELHWGYFVHAVCAACQNGIIPASDRIEIPVEDILKLVQE